MTEIADNVIPAPPCPLCGSPTVLKQRHKNAKHDTCVFKCTGCGVEYPMHVPAPPPGQPRTPA